MSTNRRKKWSELLLAAVAFAALVVIVEGAGLERALVLPTWIGLMLAGTARSGVACCRRPS